MDSRGQVVVCNTVGETATAGVQVGQSLAAAFGSVGAPPQPLGTVGGANNMNDVAYLACATVHRDVMSVSGST